MVPGEILYGEGGIALNEGRPVTRLTVLNAADRPVQVGSHYHFAEANPGLRFDRVAAHGLRLHKEFAPIASTRGVTKADMRENDAMPHVHVEPDSFAVTIDGEPVEPAPAAELPMAQRYFLF